MWLNNNTQDSQGEKGFEELSSLLDQTINEPNNNISSTQAFSEDGQIVELGENGANTIHKDI